ncbi:MAG: M1 family metallopeptidase [Anaerolineae bacterium]
MTPYYQAMLPQFASDVDAIAQAGASRYYLQVQLELPVTTTGPTGPRLTGLEQIRYTNTETSTLSDIYFHLYPNLPGYDGQMEVERVQVDGQTLQTELQEDNTALRVPLAQPLTPGATALITVTYSATIPTQTDEGYNIFSASENTLALAGFYPTIAVYDETGWNTEIPPPYGDATYLDTSLYRVDLTVPDKLAVAASGSLLNRTANPDGTKTLSLASGPMRDFYVAARADYQVLTDTVNGVLVNSYYPPALTNGGKLALRYATDALEIFSRDFGPYPYAEFDIVATPTTAGGVEYPGIVVIAQNLYDQQGGFFEHAAVHEVAHQWWYGLVGNDQIDNPWLDESLTNYSTIFYWEAVEGPEVAQKIQEDLFLAPYEYAKEQGQDRGVMGPVSDFSLGEYGLFVYGKGPLFFNALRQEVGDDTYLKVMQTYLARYKYKIAQPDDLFTIIEEVSGRNVEPLMGTWLQDKVVP